MSKKYIPSLSGVKKKASIKLLLLLVVLAILAAIIISNSKDVKQELTIVQLGS